PEDVIPAEPGHYLLDLVDVHQVRPVNAPEGRRVQAGLELVEGPEVTGALNLARNYINRVVGHGRENDVLGLDEHEALAHLHRQLARPFLFRFNSLSHTLEV